MLELEKLKKLPTKRLLAYHKAARKRFFQLEKNCVCSICQDCFIWSCEHEYQFEEKIVEFNNFKKHLEEIKDEMSKREHIPRKAA